MTPPVTATAEKARVISVPFRNRCPYLCRTIMMLDPKFKIQSSKTDHMRSLFIYMLFPGDIPRGEDTINTIPSVVFDSKGLCECYCLFPPYRELAFLHCCLNCLIDGCQQCIVSLHDEG